MNEKKTMEQLNRLTVPEYTNSPKTPIWVVLDNVRSGLNVGGIFRTADAFRVSEVLCCGYTPAPPHRDVLKSALGATETVSFAVFAHTAEAIHHLKNQGIRVFAVEQTVHSQDLMQFALNENDRIALVFGNEVHGVDQEVINLCDGAIEVEQQGTKHSLNVSVCAGILIHQLCFRLKR